jgi:hypothetical protein
MYTRFVHESELQLFGHPPDRSGYFPCQAALPGEAFAASQSGTPAAQSQPRPYGPI